MNGGVDAVDAIYKKRSSPALSIDGTAMEGSKRWRVGHPGVSVSLARISVELVLKMIHVGAP